MLFLPSSCRRAGGGLVVEARCQDVRSPSETDVCSDAANGASGLDGDLSKGRRGGRKTPLARAVRREPVSQERGFGEPDAAVLVTPRREARSRSSQSELCWTSDLPSLVGRKTARDEAVVSINNTSTCQARLDYVACGGAILSATELIQAASRGEPDACASASLSSRRS